MQALVAPDCGFFTAIAQHGRYFQRIFDILPLEQIYVCETDPSLVPSGVVLVGFTTEGIRAVLVTTLFFTSGNADPRCADQPAPSVLYVP